MDKQKSNKQAWKHVGMLAKALLRLFFVVTTVISGYIAVGLAKISEWSGIIQDKLS